MNRQLEIATAFCDMLKQTPPCPFVAEGIEWEVVDAEDGEESSEAHTLTLDLTVIRTTLLTWSIHKDHAVTRPRAHVS